MIKVLREASWERETGLEDMESSKPAPPPAKTKDLATILNPLKNIDGIPEMQQSVKTLQAFIQDAGGDIGSLRMGVESIYYSMWPLTDLQGLSKKGWNIEPKDSYGGRAPVMTFSDFRKWIMDDHIKWEEIEQTLNGIIRAGAGLRQMLKEHKIENERNYDDPRAGYAKISLTGNETIINDLCAQGTKGGSFNAYGPYEKLLSLVMKSDTFPKAGRQGEGDINFGTLLIEVKSVDTGNLKSKCKVPKPQLEFTDGGLLLVKRNGNSLECLFFKDQDIMDRVLRHGKVMSAKPDPKTGKRKVLPNAIDKKGLDQVFVKAGVLNKNYLIYAGYGPKVKADVEDDEYVVADDDDTVEMDNGEEEGEE